MQLFINNWSAVLTAPATASAASLSVPLADAAKLTGLGGGDHYLLTLAELDGSGVETAWEIVKVTGSASGVLTVLRGQEGTGARDWAAAAVISARVTKGGLEALRAGTGTAVGDDVPQALGVASPGSSAAASRQDHVHAKPTAADIGAATTAQGAKADTAVQPGALTSGLAGKVDKDGTKVLSDQNYTAAEKAKLAGIEGPQFKGLHISLAALQAAHPTAAAGNYADVDSGAGADVARYIWDVSDSKWLIQSGATGSMTAAQIKTAYESNPDTNAYTDAEKTKLGGIAANATANPNTDSLAESGTPTNKWFTEARVRAALATGLSFADSTVIAATDSFLQIAGKLAARLALAFDRENHTGSQAISTVTGLDAALAKALYAPVITESTTGRTLALTDGAAYIRHTNASASTVTIPPQSSVAWLAYTEIHIRRAAAGNLTLTPGSGVTLNAPSGGTLVMTNAMSVTLKRVAADAWDVIGQTVAS